MIFKKSFKSKFNRAFKNKSKKKRENFKYKNYSIKDLRTYVLEIQEQIAVDLRNGDIKNAQTKIKSLLRSDKARAYAVYLTISSPGAKSKGLSPKRPISNSEYENLIKELWQIIKKPNSYKASPLSRTLIPKANKSGFRPISVPSYIDRALQNLFRFILEIIQEETADPNSFGFRPFRSPGWAAKSIMLNIWNRKGYGCPNKVILFDIAKCFDSIDHDFILKNIGTFQYKGQSLELIPNKILAEWLKCGFILKNDSIINKTNAGVPQGGPISPVIANMALNGLENFILNKIKEAYPTPSLKIGSKGINPIKNSPWLFLYKDKEIFCSLSSARNSDINWAIHKFHPFMETSKRKFAYQLTVNSDPLNPNSYYGWTAKPIYPEETSLSIKRDTIKNSWAYLARFADDFIIFCYSELAEKIAINAAQEFLTPRGLKLNLSKTISKDLPFEKFDFLGYQFKIYFSHGKLKIYYFAPKEKLENIISKAANIFNKTKDTETCFIKLNSLLTGWCNYYSSANASKQFQYLNYRLWHLTYRYFWRKYKFRSSFIRKGKKLFKRKLSAFIWHNHFKSRRGQARWWFLSKYKRRSKRNRKLDLFLISPSKIKIIQPSIKIFQENSHLGLNAFHPIDREILAKKALQWKSGLIGKILQIYKGQCANCGLNFLSNNYPINLHHAKPIQFGGEFKISNLRPLCIPCHMEVTKAIKQLDIDKILEFESKNILIDIISSLKERNII